MPTKKKPVKKVVKKSVKKPVKKQVKKAVVKKATKKENMRRVLAPVKSIIQHVTLMDELKAESVAYKSIFDVEESTLDVDVIESDLEAQAAEFNDIEDVIDSADMGIVHVPKQDDGEPLAFADRVDKDQTIVYVIDESGSMSRKMEPEPQSYDFTQEALDKFQQRILSEFADEAYNDDPDQVGLEHVAASQWLDEGLNNRDNLIRYILDNDLVAQNRDIEVVAKVASEPVTRNQCMKDAMKKFVEQRFKKYPGSRVAVIGFKSCPTVRCEAGTSKEDVLNAISMLHAGGGTRIYDAVVAGLNQVAKSPSPMRANHIILVSDGEDYTASNVEELLPTMRKNDIVFDFIFIKGHGSMIDPDIRKMLEKVTRQTGGDYFEVTKASDFEQKFLEVSHRLCLPVGR